MTWLGRARRGRESPGVGGKGKSTGRGAGARGGRKETGRPGRGKAPGVLEPIIRKHEGNVNRE
jgi:hypothetical protein